MLVEFSVGNFKSFKDIVTLSLLASKRKSRLRSLDEKNTFLAPDNSRLLKSAVIYGANASGKSNLLKSISYMKYLVLESLKSSNKQTKNLINRFVLSNETEDKPTFRQIVFFIDEVRFRYGFEINEESVSTEWLFAKFNKKEVKLFTREKQEIKLNTLKLKGANKFKKNVGINVLFLSVLASLEIKIAKSIIEWFNSNINVISSLSEEYYKFFTVNEFEKNLTNEITRFVRNFDVGFDAIKSERVKDEDIVENTPDNLRKQILENERYILTKHNKYDKNGNIIGERHFNLEFDESKGTEKLFYLSGPILDTLARGSILCIDELDSSLHPIVTQYIMNLFNSIEYNKKNAQLLIATHDINLLNKNLLRRDQIWFTEKDKYGATHLFSLTDYKKIVRNDEAYEKNYIIGKYGAIPYIGNLKNIF